MPEPSGDERLVRAAAAGDSAAFGDLLQRHYSALLRVCFHLTRDATLAHDCAQDACITALLHFEQLRSATSFGAWLVGIGRHTCQHALRAKKARQLLDVPAEIVDERACAPVSYVVMSDLSASLRHAVEDLPTACRDAVHAFYFDGLGYAEASGKLHISVSALKVRLHEGRRILRHHYRLVDPVPQVSRPLNPRALAAHEAAHAVLHIRAGGHVQRVSIAPVSAVWVDEAVGGPRSHRDLPAGAQLQVLMAGEAATYLQSRRTAHVGRSGDRDAAGALALATSDGDEVEAALLVDSAWRAARDALEEDRTWRHVQRVARKLLAVRTLDGDDLRRLSSDSFFDSKQR
jgi:RNA polymerase sigma-70 factor, ECF subfamily